jgi:Ca-activated chloride channel homolog
MKLWNQLGLLSPGMLSFLAVLPLIVLLYLLKRTYLPQVVPSTLLWWQLLREMEANRPWQKLRRNLLLLLQLLAAALLAFALARPTWSGAGVVADQTIVVLDLSPSMAAKAGDADGAGKTRLDASKSQVGELIDKLGAGQKVTLIGMGREARVLAASDDRAELHKRLDEAVQEYGTVDYEGGLSLAAALSAQQPDSAIQVYSDGNWGVDPQLLPHFAKVPQVIEPTGDSDNLAVTHAAAVTSRDKKSGESVTSLVATVEHLGDGEKTVEVEVQDEGGKLLGVREAKVPANGRAELTWDGLPQQPAYKVVLKGTDALALDNERVAIPEQTAAAKAWLMTKGNLFLEKALAVGGRLTVEKGTDPASPPADAALYVFDGVMPTAWPSADAAVLLINPPQVPGVLKMGETRQPGKLQLLQPDSPILQHVDLEQVHLQELREVQDAPWLKPVVKSGEAAMLLVGEQAGHQIAVLPFDLHQSDLPLLPAFPILMKQLTEALLPHGGAAVGEATVGDVVHVPSTVRETGWKVTDPAGRSQDVSKEMIEQGFRPEMPGLYRVQGAEGQELRLAALVPESESKLAAAAVSLPVVGQEEGNAVTAKDAVGGGGREIWRYAAALILLLLFAEWGVYKRGISV